jgi:AAA+ ATPase superfamily predicted ATPase
MATKTVPFLGRERELALLRRFLHKKTASLLVIKGRRRIGKSRLVEEFAKDMKFLSFAGLAPNEKTNAQSQRDEFARQLNEQTGLPKVNADDWSKLFALLAEKTQTGRIILFFDEISWMGSEDADFAAKIKNAWDTQFKKNPELIFILCGSASFWIEKNILSHTGFVGRVSHTLTLEELPLKDCSYFWGRNTTQVAAFEKFKILSVTGGVPRYLEEINPHLSAEENIRLLCFSKGGMLVNEFDQIFSSLLKRNSPVYRKIVQALTHEAKDTITIGKELNIPVTGLLSEYLEELVTAGFIKRDYTWDIKSKHNARLSKYRLSDNYLRFYLRYIYKYRDRIERDMFAFKQVASLPEWNIIMGLQFENLVLNNRQYIHQALGITAQDIVNDNPFFQNHTKKQRGCQIDYLIQTNFDTLYVCEIKFSRNLVGTEIIDTMQQKIAQINRPKGFSCHPVLIHVNGVSEEVITSNYFAAIVDMSTLIS